MTTAESSGVSLHHITSTLSISFHLFLFYFTERTWTECFLLSLFPFLHHITRLAGRSGGGVGETRRRDYQLGSGVMRWMDGWMGWVVGARIGSASLLFLFFACLLLSMYVCVCLCV